MSNETKHTEECREALLPCPFCGGEAEYFVLTGFVSYPHRVRCTNPVCGAIASNGTAHKNDTFNAKKWNTRVRPQATLEDQRKAHRDSKCGRNGLECLVCYGQNLSESASVSAETALSTFAARIASMTQDGEEIDGGEFVMENDGAVRTLNELIDEARGLVGGAATGQPVGLTFDDIADDLAHDVEFRDAVFKTDEAYFHLLAHVAVQRLQPYLRLPERETVDLSEVRLLANAALGILPDEMTCTPEEVKQDAILIAQTARKYLKMSNRLEGQEPKAGAQ